MCGKAWFSEYKDKFHHQQAGETQNAQNKVFFWQNFGQTFLLPYAIIIDVTPPIHYIVFATPHKKRNTFSWKAWLPRQAFHFVAGVQKCHRYRGFSTIIRLVQLWEFIYNRWKGSIFWTNKEKDIKSGRQYKRTNQQGGPIFLRDRGLPFSGWAGRRWRCNPPYADR